MIQATPMFFGQKVCKYLNQFCQFSVHSQVILKGMFMFLGLPKEKHDISITERLKRYIHLVPLLGVHTHRTILL